MSTLDVTLASRSESKYLERIEINRKILELEDIGERQMGILMVLKEMKKEMRRYEIMEEYLVMLGEELPSSTAAENLDKLAAKQLVMKEEREEVDKKTGKLLLYKKGRPPYIYSILVQKYDGYEQIYS